MSLTALHAHKEFASYLACDDDTIAWDVYTPEQYSLFKTKLNALFQNHPMKSDVCKNIYERSIGQTKYTNKNLVAQFILVTVAPGNTFADALNATSFSVHFLVRTRKCMNNDNSRGCCMIFIDEYGRVYQNWKHFISTNRLPEGVALTPSNGIYTRCAQHLNMEWWTTPASTLCHRLLVAADVGAKASAITATGIILGGMMMPALAAAAVGASLVCAGSSAYSIIRSGCLLKDRNTHDQGIWLDDPTARRHWFVIISGALNVSSTVINRGVARTVQAGQRVTSTQGTYMNRINTASCVVSGAGVASELICMILGRTDGNADIAQLATSLTIFTHSLHNMRTATAIIAGEDMMTVLQSELKLLIMSYKVMSRHTPFNRRDFLRYVIEIPDNVLNMDELTNSSSFFNALYNKILEIIQPIRINPPSFLDCFSYLLNELGVAITDYLVRKVKEFTQEYSRSIESFIRSSVFFECVLWQFYKEFKKCVVNWTVEDLESQMSVLCVKVLKYYQKMWRRSGNFRCEQCGGNYQVSPTD